MQRVKNFLQNLEWSAPCEMCPTCRGVPPSWHGHPSHMTEGSIGHRLDCRLAHALIAVGEKPLFKGEFKGVLEFEYFIGENGMFGVRRKTADGCPRYLEYLRKNKPMSEETIFRENIRKWFA